MKVSTNESAVIKELLQSEQSLNSSHQSSEDQGFGEKAEGRDGDEEDEAEDDEKMFGRVLSHRAHQVEQEQVLQNILEKYF